MSGILSFLGLLRRPFGPPRNDGEKGCLTVLVLTFRAVAVLGHVIPNRRTFVAFWYNQRLRIVSILIRAIVSVAVPNGCYRAPPEKKGFY